MTERTLTPKQQRFADEYIKDPNATQAAIRAGYSKATATQMGAENLRKPYLAKYIEKRLQEISDAKVMDAKEVLETLTRIARGQIVETTVVTLKKPTVVTVEGANGLYEKLTYEDEAQVFESPTKNSDRVRALELIGKRHMLWTDKVQATIEAVNFVEDVPDGDDDG